MPDLFLYALVILVAISTVGVLWYRVVLPILDALDERGAWRMPDWLRYTPDQTHYVTHDDTTSTRNDNRFSAFEPAERPLNVQPVQNLNGPPELINGSLDDITRAQVKRLANLYQAGQLTALSALSVYFSVPKGGSKLYQTLTEELKAELARRGHPLEPNPRQPIERKPVSGLPQPPGVLYAGDTDD